MSVHNFMFGLEKKLAFPNAISMKPNKTDATEEMSSETYPAALEAIL